MNHTGELDEQTLNSNLAVAYDPWIGPKHLGQAAPHSDSNAIGSGSLYSTVEDLYRWDRSFSSNVVLSEKAKTQMLSDGLGVDAQQVFGKTLVSHNGVYCGYTGF